MNGTADLVAEDVVDESVLGDPGETVEPGGTHVDLEVIAAAIEVVDLGGGTRDRSLDALLEFVGGRHPSKGSEGATLAEAWSL
jgi:hypothetical protein